jgi:Novel STAND NTPase 1
MRLVTQAPEGRDRVWPDLPYKGLNYYDLTDISIFAGREDDITRCARLVQLPRTKLLFLHGGTGCGKSSFVRAGLIPFLERREFGYSFVREDEAELMSHFVRSTDDPFSRLAEVLFQLGQTQRTRMTPVGLSTVDLSECIQPDQMNLQRFMGRSPENLLEVLSRFARKIPETLVLIFDQVEEVLTLRPGRNGDRSRRRFFEFLDLFIDAGIDIKIVLALRTEYFGRVLDLLHYNISEAGAISYYLLKDLSEEELIRAIVRPTSDLAIESYGSPRKRYGFRYAPGVPQAIARDLKREVQAGGTLPVMQLVCSRLYDAVQAGRVDDETVNITFEHYRGLGGVQGQINGHLSDVLDRMSTDSAVASTDAQLESRRWRRLLLTLAKTQVDGTVTTEMRPIADFIDDAERAKCIVPAREGVGFLTRKENRILRDVTVYNAAYRKEIPCLALGHDAIGLALTKGPTSKDVGERILQNMRSVAKFGAAALFLGVMLLNLAQFLSNLVGGSFIGGDTLFALNLRVCWNHRLRCDNACGTLCQLTWDRCAALRDFGARERPRKIRHDRRRSKTRSIERNRRPTNVSDVV